MSSLSKVIPIQRLLVLLFIFSISLSTISPVFAEVSDTPPPPSYSGVGSAGAGSAADTPIPDDQAARDAAYDARYGTAGAAFGVGPIQDHRAAIPPPSNDNSACSDTSTETGFLNIAGKIVDKTVCYILKYTLMKLVGAGLYLTSRSFDLVVNLSLFTINKKIAENGTGGIYQAWSMVRDICNIIGLFFFFVSIFYIIIGKGLETRKYLVKLVLFAILLNFSFPISKAVLDFTNIFALNIYGGMTATNDGQYKFLNLDSVYGSALGDNVGISYQLMQIIGLQTSIVAAGDIDQDAATSLKASSGISDTANMLVLIVMTAAVAIVFAQATMVFVSRTVLMFFCIITSPVMFMGGILPPNSFFNLDDWVTNWTKKFFGGAFMAPVMMVNLWLAIEVMKFTKNLIAGNALIKIVLMVITVVVFQKAVEYSAKMVDGIGEKAAAIGGKIGGKMMSGLASRPAAFAMRNTVNRAASWGLGKATKEGGWLHRQSEKSGAFGRLANSTLKSVDNVNSKVRGSSGNVLGAVVSATSFGKINNLVADEGGLDRDNEAIDILKADNQKAKVERQQKKDQKEGEKQIKESTNKDDESKYLSRRSDEVAGKVTDAGGFAEQKDNLEKDLNKITAQIDEFKKGNKKDDNGNYTRDELAKFKNRKTTLSARLDLAVSHGDKDLISELHKEIKQNKVDSDDYKENIGLADLKKKEVKHLESLAKIEEEIEIAHNASANLRSQSQNAAIDSRNAELAGTQKLASAAMATAPIAILRSSIDQARAVYDAKYKALDTATHKVNQVTARELGSLALEIGKGAIGMPSGENKNKDAVDHNEMEKMIAMLKAANGKASGKKPSVPTTPATPATATASTPAPEPAANKPTPKP